VKQQLQWSLENNTLAEGLLWFLYIREKKFLFKTNASINFRKVFLSKNFFDYEKGKIGTVQSNAVNKIRSDLFVLSRAYFNNTFYGRVYSIFTVSIQ
jgi:hypothetical protein